jgi:hypothetical protein
VKTKIKITHDDIEAFMGRAIEVVGNSKGAALLYYSTERDMLVARQKNKISAAVKEQLQNRPELVAGRFVGKCGGRFQKPIADPAVIRKSLKALADRLNGLPLEKNRHNSLSHTKTRYVSGLKKEAVKKGQGDKYLIRLTPEQWAQVNYPLTVRLGSGYDVRAAA